MKQQWKTITITQPYPTLIMQGTKRIETRSRPTSYRGPILIHTSAKKIPREWRENEELMVLVENEDDMKYGYIIGKATLVDCVLMTKEFIESVKRNRNEYITGFYKVGRYALILEDVEPIEPIKTRGYQPLLWNYYGEI